MLKKMLFALALTVLLLPIMVSAAENINLRIDAKESTYISTGQEIIEVTVENPSENWDVAGVTLSATGEGLSFTYDPTSASISKGGKKTFKVNTAGSISGSVSVRITANAPSTTDYTVQNGSTTVTLRPADARIRIISPSAEVVQEVINISVPHDVSFGIVIVNNGEIKLSGITATDVEPDGNLSCSASGMGDLNIEGTLTISVSCSNVMRSDKIGMRIIDSSGKISLAKIFSFRFVEKFIEAPVNVSEGGPERTYGDVVEPSGESSGSSWSMFRGNAKRTGFSSGTGALAKDFVVAWSYSTGAGAFGSPVVGDINGDGNAEIVVTVQKKEGTAQKSIIALDRFGRRLWDFATDGTIYSAATIADLNEDGNGDVIFGTNDAEIYALDGKTGSELWSADKKIGPLRSSPVAYDVDGDGNIEVIIGYDKGVLSFDGESGIEEWFYTVDGGVSSSPALGNLDDDPGLEVVFGSERGFVYAVNAESGSLSWSLDIGSPVISSTPAIAPDNSILIGTQGGSLVRIKNGKVASSYPTGSSISGSPGVVVTEDGFYVVFATSKEDYVHTAYQKTENSIYGISNAGGLLWALSTDGWSAFASPALADIDSDGRIEAVIGTREGKLYSLDAETGSIDWTYHDGTGIFASPAIADVDGDDELEIVVAYLFSNQVRMLDSKKKPDLVVESIAFSNEFPRDAEVITVSAVVKNIGDVEAASSQVSFYRRSPILDYPLQNVSLGVLGPGESGTANFTWGVVVPAGEIGIYAVADSTNVVNESNEINNGKYKELGNDLIIVRSGLPSLNKVSNNRTETATITIGNVGRLNLQGVEVALFLERDGTRTEIERAKVDINTSKEADTSFSFRYTPSYSVSTLSLVIDPDNKVNEVYEDNNAVNTTIIPPEPPVVVIETPPVPAQELPILPIILVVVVIAVLLAVKKKLSKRVKKKTEGKVGKRLQDIRGGVEGGGEAWSGEEPTQPQDTWGGSGQQTQGETVGEPVQETSGETQPNEPSSNEPPPNGPSSNEPAPSEPSEKPKSGSPAWGKSEEEKKD